MFGFKIEMSRLRKKLLLYFILIAIVSISVSAEIILEVSTSSFKEKVEANVYMQLEKRIPAGEIESLKKDLDFDSVLAPLFELRNRMILFLLVVSVSIFVAFVLFTRDIISPMDGMVDATKRIAEGDLTVTVPVVSEDEIGQVGRLINDMNVNLQDMIMQIKQEVKRHKEQIVVATNKMNEIVKEDVADGIMESRKMKVSDFKKMVKLSRDVMGLLESMSVELSALQAFVNMYKIYTSQPEMTQAQLDAAFKNYEE